MMIVSRFSRALVTTSTTSSWHHWVSRPLIRIARTVRPQSRSLSAVTALPRASSLCAGAQASSRSRNTRSAPTRRPWRTCGRCSRAPRVPSGAAARSSSELLSQHTPGRAGRRCRRRSSPSSSPYTSALCSPSRGPRWLTAPGRGGEAGHRRLDGHRARARASSTVTKTSRCAQLLVGDQIARCRRPARRPPRRRRRRPWPRPASWWPPSRPPPRRPRGPAPAGAADRRSRRPSTRSGAPDRAKHPQRQRAVSCPTSPATGRRRCGRCCAAPRCPTGCRPWSGTRPSWS